MNKEVWFQGVYSIHVRRVCGRLRHLRVPASIKVYLLCFYCSPVLQCIYISFSLLPSNKYNLAYTLWVKILINWLNKRNKKGMKIIPLGREVNLARIWTYFMMFFFHYSTKCGNKKSEFHIIEPSSPLRNVALKKIVNIIKLHSNNIRYLKDQIHYLHYLIFFASKIYIQW